MMGKTLTLVPINRDGTPRSNVGPLSEATVDVLRATREHYQVTGFHEPWIGYLALADSTPVGTCAFKCPPHDGRVEIAYSTFPEHEGRGIATAMAAELLALAWKAAPSVVVAAQTLPAHSASHRVLEKLGFRHVATVDHPEDGTVWEWQLEPELDDRGRVQG